MIVFIDKNRSEQKIIILEPHYPLVAADHVIAKPTRTMPPQSLTLFVPKIL
jgi:hypothetical protein